LKPRGEKTIKAFQKLYDISVSLGEEAIDWPGNPPYSRELISRKEDGEQWNVSKLVMPTHVGTHVDTPAHYFAQGKNLDAYPIERWILPAHVVSIKNREVIQPGELANIDLRPGEALLFKTANSLSGQATSGVFSERFVYMSLEATDFCIARKVSLVGIDYVSVEKYDTEDSPVHQKLLENDILILEGINLKDVPPGRYILFCSPLKIKGAEGAPARAVLVR
jgi:arylformamidase